MSPSTTPAVSLITGDPNANRKRAAERSEEPQAPGSEFTQTIPGDLQIDIDRLDAIREECGVIMGKLYASHKNGSGVDFGYSGPPYLQRQAMQAELEELNAEEGQIRARLQSFQWILPATDPDDDNKDPNQPAQAKD